MNPTVRSWLKKSRQELDEIYCNALPGEIPTGDTEGTAIMAGSLLSQSVAAMSRMWLWQGKVFDIFCPSGQKGILYNKITPLSLTYIVAKVYRGISWDDGKETIVLDYSRTSFVAQKIRDEIREVEPGVYLGKVWWGSKPVFYFALVRSR